MTSHKAIVSGISGRYAVALFELALDNKALKAVEADLAALKELLTESADLQALISSPLMSREEQSKGVAGVSKLAKLNALTANFLGVLAANRRLSALGAVMADFDKLVAHHNGEVKAEVTSAHALTKTQVTALAKNLKAAVGNDVSIEATVDETLLGGLKVKVGSQMIDSSLKTKLDNLAIAMKGVQ